MQEDHNIGVDQAGSVSRTDEQPQRAFEAEDRQKDIHQDEREDAKRHGQEYSRKPAPRRPLCCRYQSDDACRERQIDGDILCERHSKRLESSTCRQQEQQSQKQSKETYAGKETQDSRHGTDLSHRGAHTSTPEPVLAILY